MPEPRDQEELKQLVGDLNAREGVAVDNLVARLISPEGMQLRAGAARFQRGLRLEAAAGPLSPLQADFEVDREGARAFAEILGWHPAATGDRSIEVVLNVFAGETGAVDPNVADLAREGAHCLVAGGIALGKEGPIDERLPNALFQASFGGSAIDTIMRRALSGFLNPLWDPVKFYEELPGGLADFEEIARRGCVAGVLGALHGFAGQMASVQDAIESRGTATADGITGLVPDGGRGRTEVTIVGSGFGAAQGVGRSVYFPRAGGGCSPASVLSWSDTEVVVTAPVDVGDGYVGFVTAAKDVSESAEAPSSGRLAGELEHCIGPAAMGVADRLHHWIPGGLLPPLCPPKRADDANHFYGGPAIASISPVAAREGDTISVTGTAFAPSDVVVADGQTASTTVLTSKHLTFLVPALSGGRHRVTVSGKDGLHSNGVDLRVLPWIKSISSPRPRPGTPITISGSGFQQGCRVRVNSEERAATFVGPQELSVVLWRPANVAPNKAGEPVTVQVVSGDGATSNSVPVTLDTYRIVALGDSVMWGQGLLPGQKYHSLVAQKVRAKYPGIGVYDEDVAAHSGAIIGLIPYTYPSGGAVAGEVPVDDPTVFQQLEQWYFNPDRVNVDLVLINGGINDIGVNNILGAPFTADIKTWCKLQCHDAMLQLLRDAVGTFGKTTKFVVPGYQLMVSWSSDTALLTYFVLALGTALGSINGAIVAGVLTTYGKWYVVTNCAAFYSEANKQLQLAVDDVNAELGGTPRVFFALPPFTDANAALAPDSWIWGITVDPVKGVVPDDPVEATRATDCTLAASVRPALAVWRCKIASLGHPNPIGAEKYADAIAQLL